MLPQEQQAALVAAGEIDGERAAIARHEAVQVREGIEIKMDGIWSGRLNDRSAGALDSHIHVARAAQGRAAQDVGKIRGFVEIQNISALGFQSELGRRGDSCRVGDVSRQQQPWLDRLQHETLATRLRWRPHGATAPTLRSVATGE